MIRSASSKDPILGSTPKGPQKPVRNAGIFKPTDNLKMGHIVDAATTKPRKRVGGDFMTRSMSQGLMQVMNHNEAIELRSK